MTIFFSLAHDLLPLSNHEYTINILSLFFLNTPTLFTGLPRKRYKQCNRTCNCVQVILIALSSFPPAIAGQDNVVWMPLVSTLRIYE